MSGKKLVIIALGSNLGDRFENLSKGLDLLKKHITVQKCSNIYRSRAVLTEGSPKEWDKDFYNCALCGETEVEPFKLLSYCKEIENTVAGGKREKSNWSPRYLDIDIISYGNEVIDTKELRIPHPGTAERAFVLRPLADIMPQWQVPGEIRTIEEILQEKDFKDQKLEKLDLRLL